MTDINILRYTINGINKNAFVTKGLDMLTC